MTGVILVVDDVPANVKLLEAKLTNEYYDVVTAKDGFEALERTKEHKPDLILLDVMMPGMDGFETCRKIKEDPDISHIPVVMVTALSDMSDRVQGLEAGADDFITKPINDTALFARVKSLVRIKVLIDELRLRDQSGAQMGIINDIVSGGLDVSGSRIVIIDDDAVQSRRMKEALSDQHEVLLYADHSVALDECKATEPDLVLISTMLSDIDGLRLATQFKAVDSLRHVPIVTLVDEDETQLMLKALDLGVNDYLVVPVDSSELAARVKTQLRRKKYQDALKSNYKESVSMAITDGLTGLYNRHYLDTHLKNMAEAALENGKHMSVIIMDMDHFKSVNDTYGHDVGDEVLIQLAKRIIDSTRSADLAARYGGEEFVVLMPETDFQSAYEVADRIRATVERTPFQVSHEIGTLSKTLSIGVASLNLQGDDPSAMLKRADTALYEAKNTGRNQVCPKAGGSASAPAAPPAAPAAPVAPAAPIVSAAPPLQPQPQPQAVAPQAQQPASTPLQQAQPPQPPSAPVPPPLEPVSRVPSVAGFDPTLAQRLSEVQQTGTGPNHLKLDDRQKEAIAELRPMKPEDLLINKAKNQSYGSPIDDEPEGTF